MYANDEMSTESQGHPEQMKMNNMYVTVEMRSDPQGHHEHMRDVKKKEERRKTKEERRKKTGERRKKKEERRKKLPREYNYESDSEISVRTSGSKKSSSSSSNAQILNSGLLRWGD